MTTRAARTLLASIALLLTLTAGLAAQAAEPEWYIDKPIKDFAFTGLVTVKADDLKAIVKASYNKRHAELAGSEAPAIDSNSH